MAVAGATGECLSEVDSMCGGFSGIRPDRVSSLHKRTCSHTELSSVFMHGTTHRVLEARQAYTRLLPAFSLLTHSERQPGGLTNCTQASACGVCRELFRRGIARGCSLAVLHRYQPFVPQGHCFCFSEDTMLCAFAKLMTRRPTSTHRTRRRVGTHTCQTYELQVL